MWPATDVGVVILCGKPLMWAGLFCGTGSDHCVEQESLQKTATKAVFLEVTLGETSVNEDQSID